MMGKYLKINGYHVFKDFRYDEKRFYSVSGSIT